ncbi:hypothetical protein FKW77_002133 [Venturia effusa]|uniref:Uncharacterized protein n=1 Tax=Venturia effusa TaxID=50376 RepID=A0A517LRG4_9PEZI|nr:hypothetical protein FKW77_002133 [Venturia effusa]
MSSPDLTVPDIMPTRRPPQPTRLVRASAKLQLPPSPAPHARKDDEAQPDTDEDVASAARDDQYYQLQAALKRARDKLPEEQRAGLDVFYSSSSAFYEESPQLQAAIKRTRDKLPEEQRAGFNVFFSSRSAFVMIGETDKGFEATVDEYKESHQLQAAIKPTRDKLPEE